MESLKDGTIKKIVPWYGMDMLTELVEKGVLQMLDLYFARLIAERSGGANASVMTAAALASAGTRDGHVCLDLARVAGRRAADLFEMSAGRPDRFPDRVSWRQDLLACPMVGTPGDRRPLILDAADRLYLYRYWKYESDLIENLKGRLRLGVFQYDREAMRAPLDRLFPSAGAGETDWQRVAALSALRHRVCIVSGGPGTGKTTTVGKIIALLLEQAGGEHRAIALTAPTGKAAARLAQSIHDLLPDLPVDPAVIRAMPVEATTIHRLLKVVPGTPYFRHHKDHRLNVDLVVVDEASMVDVALMARLLDALPLDARIILLGDRDQLSSVEAGSVLGDLCDRDRLHEFSTDFCRDMHVPGEGGADVCKAPAGPALLADSIVMLRKNYRFSEGGGIGALSRAVGSGDADGAMDILCGRQYADLGWENVSGPRPLAAALEKIVREGYRRYFAQEDPGALLDTIQGGMILCAVKAGPSGVNDVNRMVTAWCRREGWIPTVSGPAGEWFDRRPVLVTRNDYRTGLYNGDIGVAVMPPGGDSGLRVFFPNGAGGVRRVAPHQLPAHETVFAMTVHKSQGSEFDTVVLILPTRDSPVMTRELIYTGITRARKKLVILGPREALQRAVSRRMARTSGLHDALWENGAASA